MARRGFSAIVNISIGILTALDEHIPVEAWPDARMVKKLLPAPAREREPEST